MIHALKSRAHAPTADVVFSQKLAEELKYEKESAVTEEPEFLKVFKAQGLWTVSSPISSFFARRCSWAGLQIEDVEANDEVTLTRKFGNEKCVCIFDGL